MTIKQLFKKIHINERGLTLAEVLASIVILSILLFSALNIIIQTAKTNTVSEQIIDATYVAQTEMEHIYQASQQGKHLKVRYGNRVKVDDGWDIYHTEQHEFHVEIRTKKSDKSPSMTRIVIYVYDDAEMTTERAQMESLYKWRD